MRRLYLTILLALRRYSALLACGWSWDCLEETSDGAEAIGTEHGSHPHKPVLQAASDGHQRGRRRQEQDHAARVFHLPVRRCKPNGNLAASGTVGCESGTELFVVGREYRVATGEKRNPKMASSATEYLLELLEEGDDAMDFWATVSEIAGATITAFSTEVPTWLRDAAVEAMTTALEKPYWTALAQTTLDDISATLARGIEDGLSIREIADLIVEDRGPDYAQYRGMATARTEIGYMSNMGGRESINQLRNETGLDIRRAWVSIFGITTRQNHWDADGIQTDENDKFHFLAQDGQTYIIDSPSDPDLPAEDRINCNCNHISDFVMDEVDNDVAQAADELLEPVADRSHHPHGTKYSEDQPRVPAGQSGGGQFGGGSGSDASDSEDADSFTPVETSQYKVSVSDKDYSKDGAKPGDKKRAKQTAEACQKEITSVLKRFPKLAKAPPVNIEISPTKIGVVSVEKDIGPDGQTAMVEKWTGECGGIYIPATEEGGLPTISIEQAKEADGPYRLGAFDVGTDAASLMRHEYGHHVHDTFAPYEEKSWWSNEYINIYERMEKLEKDGATSKEASKQTFGQISMYAGTHDGELFSESFSAYTHKDYGKEGMPRLPKNIEDRLKKLLGKRKGG